MNRIHLALGAITFALLGPTAAPHAQTTTEAAKADGKAFGRDKAAAAQAAATTAPDGTRVPNYEGVPSQSDYFGDPERMAHEAASRASSHTGYRTMRDSMDRRARFDPVDIEATIARSRELAEDPLAWTSGMAIGGTQGRCVPLPGGTGTAGRYMATCNTGYSASRETRTCRVTLEPVTAPATGYIYRCSEFDLIGDLPCSALPQATCQRTRRLPFRCLQWGWIGGRKVCSESDSPMYEYTCSEPVPGLPPDRTSGGGTVTLARDESQCDALAADADCTQGPETCTDSDPVTRIIDGVAVTQPCWAWTREYTCGQFTEGSDCETLESTPGCNLVREDCLAGEPCGTWERVYDCPVPDAPASPNQFICDGDIYCIDGSCETIERQPNTEFKDAVVALNAMNQARREFDADTLTLFEGERSTCSSKVFGVLNCCKGKGFPLIPGISLLVALGCDREEVLLHQRDAQGLCAYVGTYCSDSFLGVCLTKKKVYCCFESRLSRILQEQGREQLNKPWGKPKEEQCRGFTLAEFARLDLSKMDFGEVYAEFTAAARLPDELEAATEIQQKIEDYYARAGQ